MNYDENDPVLMVQEFLIKKRFSVDKGDKQAYNELKPILDDYAENRNFDQVAYRLLNKDWVIGNARDYKTIEDACKLYRRLLIKAMERRLRELKRGEPVESIC